ncbi:Yos1-like-domain-containing protein [Xylariaceae sp. FL1019]|nr:Yos1-like-domain-containing protein [Xylariaceae sp. FL1019]
MLFGFGNLIYIIVLLLNSLAILSEDRFLARIGYSTNTYEPGFGNDPNNAKAKTTNLIKSVQTVMRGTFISPTPTIQAFPFPHTSTIQTAGESARRSEDRGTNS